MNSWLRELARILVAVAAEDIADAPDEPAACVDAAAERGPRQHGSSGAESSRQKGPGDGGTGPCPRQGSVRVRRVEHGIFLEPMVTDLKAWLAELDRFADVPFMADGRKQPSMPESV